MTDKKVYTLPQLREIISEQKYKYCNVADLQGETIVPYNSIKSPISKKLDEINTRLKRLPDGVYCVTCKTVYGTNNKGDKYYIGKGKFPKTLSEENLGVKEEEKVTKKEKNSSAEHLLSLDNFTENMRELAELRGKVAGLETENKRLIKENEELCAELDEQDDEEGVSETNSLAGFGQVAKDIMLSAEPILDRFIKNDERKIRLAEMKLLAEQGYEIPGAKRINGNGHAKQTKQIQEQSQEGKRQLPAINGEGWDEYIDHLLNLSEEDFEKHLAQLQQLDEDYYNAVCAEVYDDGEEEEEEEQNG